MDYVKTEDIKSFLNCLTRVKLAPKNFLYSGNSEKKGAISARLYLLKSGSLFLCHQTKSWKTSTYENEWVVDRRLGQFLENNNLVYPAGYIILRSLLKLGQSTLEKIDQRRSVIEGMTEEIKAILGKITPNQADKPNFPFE